MRIEHIGPATLYCGDCLDVLPEISGVDAVLTDMPYSSGGFTRSDRTQAPAKKYQTSGLDAYFPNFSGDNRDQHSFTLWAAEIARRLLACCEPHALLFSFIDWRNLPCMADAVQVGGWLWRGIIPWDKTPGGTRPLSGKFQAQCEYVLWASNGPMPQGCACRRGLFASPPPKGAERVHMTQKPVPLLSFLFSIRQSWSLILDPFMGAGSTGVAAITCGARFVGVEMVPEYFDQACRRIEEAVRAAEGAEQ